jgi:hypothetical protein
MQSNGVRSSEISCLDFGPAAPGDAKAPGLSRVKSSGVSERGVSEKGLGTNGLRLSGVRSIGLSCLDARPPGYLDSEPANYLRTGPQSPWLEGACRVRVVNLG